MELQFHLAHKKTGCDTYDSILVRGHGHHIKELAATKIQNLPTWYLVEFDSKDLTHEEILSTLKANARNVGLTVIS